MGHMQQRALVLDAIANLPQAGVATNDEVMHLIERHALFGHGVGYIDCHLLAAVRLTAGSKLWTRDKRLASVAASLAVAADVGRR